MRKRVITTFLVTVFFSAVYLVVGWLNLKSLHCSLEEPRRYSEFCNISDKFLIYPLLPIWVSGIDRLWGFNGYLTLFVTFFIIWGTLFLLASVFSPLDVSGFLGYKQTRKS